MNVWPKSGKLGGKAGAFVGARREGVALQHDKKVKSKIILILWRWRIKFFKLI